MNTKIHSNAFFSAIFGRFIVVWSRANTFFVASLEIFVIFHSMDISRSRSFVLCGWTFYAGITVVGPKMRIRLLSCCHQTYQNTTIHVTSFNLCSLNSVVQQTLTFGHVQLRRFIHTCALFPCCVCVHAMRVIWHLSHFQISRFFPIFKSTETSMPFSMQDVFYTMLIGFKLHLRRTHTHTKK